MQGGRDCLHFGLKKIAHRLQLSINKTRQLLNDGVIRGYRTEKLTWYCIESELNEDIKKVPGKL